MNSTEYQRAITLLAAQGMAVSQQEYSERDFGSWFVVTSTRPARRLVWDGKERWYTVEEETDAQFNGLPVWRELWIARNPTTQSLETAVNALLAPTV